jgi:hypothetical protein
MNRTGFIFIHYHDSDQIVDHFDVFTRFCKCPMDTREFARFCKCLNPNFKVPCYKTRVSKIAELAGIIRQLQIPIPQNPVFCSLMTDGATKFKHHFLSLIMAREGQVIFLDLIKLPNQRSETIAAAILPHIERLRGRNYIVTAVYTDNAETRIFPAARLRLAHDAHRLPRTHHKFGHA